MFDDDMDISPCGSTPTEESMLELSVTNVSSVGTASSTPDITTGGHMNNGGSSKYTSGRYIQHAGASSGAEHSSSREASSSSSWAEQSTGNGINIVNRPPAEWHLGNRRTGGIAPSNPAVAGLHTVSASPRLDIRASRTGTSASPLLEKSSSSLSRSGGASPWLQRGVQAVTSLSATVHKVGPVQSRSSAVLGTSTTNRVGGSSTPTTNQVVGSVTITTNRVIGTATTTTNRVVRPVSTTANQVVGTTTTNQTVINTLTTLQQAFAQVS